jgi:hypothetical protein
MVLNEYQRHFLDVQRTADQIYVGDGTIELLDQHWDAIYAEIKDKTAFDSYTIQNLLRKHGLKTIGFMIFCVYFRLKTGINFRFRSDYLLAYLFI